MTPGVLDAWAAQWAPAMVRACVHGTAAVALAALVCRLFRRLPPSVRAAIWWLACAKTVAALFAPGPLSVPILPAAERPSFAVPSRAVAASRVPREALGRWASTPAAPESPPAAPTRRLPTVPGIALSVWGTALAALTVGLARERGLLRRSARRAGPYRDPETVGDLAARLGLGQAPPVLVGDDLPGSLVLGPVRPAVLLCRSDVERLSLPEQRALIAHELAHIRRGDLWSGLVPSAARLLFFFHPLVWIACREYDLAREAACDADALRVSGLAPTDYGRLLLKLSLPGAAQNAATLGTAPGAASPGGQQLRRRIEGIRASGIRRLPRGVAALVPVALGLGLCMHPVPIPAVAAAARTPVPPTARRRPIVETPRRLPLSTSPRTAQPAPSSHEKEFPMSHPLRAVPNRISAALAAVTLLGVGAAVPAPAQVVPEAPAKPAAAPAPRPAPQPVPAPAPAPRPANAPAPQPPPGRETRLSFTLRQGESISTRTSDRAVAEAQRALAKAQTGDCIVVDRDGKRYLITDPGVLAKVRENYAPVDAVAKRMEELGKQMEGIGKPMEELGKQMEGIGKQMEGIGNQMGAVGAKLGAAVDQGKPEEEIKALREQMEVLRQQMQVPQEQMRALGDRMREQGGKIRPLGQLQRENGLKLRGALRTAEAGMATILDDAIKNNLAVEQPR